MKAWPAGAVPRLSLSSTGTVVYTLKTRYREGTTQASSQGLFAELLFVLRIDFVSGHFCFDFHVAGRTHISTGEMVTTTKQTWPDVGFVLKPASWASWARCYATKTNTRLL